MKRKTALMVCMIVAFTTTFSGCGKNNETKSKDISDAAEVLEIGDAVSDEKEMNYNIADFDVMDYITLGEYKGVDAEYVIPGDVTDDDISGEIDGLLEENAEYTDINDRGAVMGDFVSIDYVGKIDGEEFEGGSAQGYELELGSNEFLEGFEEQLVGAKTGDKVTVKVKFPADYELDDSLAGKEAEFSVDVNSIFSKSMPEYNDEFIKKISDNCQTTAEYEAQLRTELHEQMINDATDAAKEEALTAAVENAQMSGYPQDLYDVGYSSTIANYQSYAEMFGLEYEEFLDQMSMSEEDLQEQAANWAKEIMVVQAIAQKEGLELGEEDYEAKVKEMADEYGYEDVEEFKESYGEFFLKADIRRVDVLEYIYDNAKVNQITEEEYEQKYLDEEENEDGSVG